MTKNERIKRYFIFFIGLCITSFGVSFVTKAALGSSPISAIPYTLSLILPRLSMGNWTIIFSALLVVAQIPLLRKDINKVELVLQMVVSVAFGYFIDLFMLCLRSFQPTAYPFRMLFLLIGCAILALGVYFQIIADVVMLPGDALCRAFTKVTSFDYGSIRVTSDMSMSIVAGILCLLFLHKLTGVREGTIIAALLIGNLVKLITKKLKPLTYRLFPEAPAEETVEADLLEAE